MQIQFRRLKTTLVILTTGLSLNALAFLDFNNYQSGYDDNDWPVWTPMYWMEEVFDGNDKHRAYQNYPYPYNNRAYNVNARHFNMGQMPTPTQAYWLESEQGQNTVKFDTPAAMSFSQDNSAKRSVRPGMNSRGF